MERDKIDKEFSSYFKEKIENNFIEYEIKKKSFDGSKRAVYHLINKNDENDVIFIKQMKIFKEKKINQETLKEIYFLVLLRQVEENYFCKLNEIKIFDDKKFVFIIFIENKISLNMIMNPQILKNEEFIRWVAFCTCLELFYLHHNNIVHNDIKPSNILIGGEPFISLCDFGAMRYEGEKSKEYTKYYVAPEYFLNDGKRRNKSDMWSLGITLIEIFYFKNISEKELEELDKEKKAEFFLELGIKEKYDSSKEEENKINYEKIKEIVKDEKAIHLIEKLVVFEPEKRYTAEEALKSEYLYDFFKDSSFNCDKLTQNFDKFLNIYNRINYLKDENDFAGIINELDLLLKRFIELDNKVK